MQKVFDIDFSNMKHIETNCLLNEYVMKYFILSKAWKRFGWNNTSTKLTSLNKQM